jgi:transcription-repair coupling factor (superfamily II helicase)
MYEQAKIELHRRVAGARELADIGALREELKDRFGPIPDPLERLLQLQEARLKFGRCGARTVGFTQGRLVVAPIELNADQVARIREDLPTAIYDRGQRTIALRVDGEPEEQFAAMSGLADALWGQYPPRRRKSHLLGTVKRVLCAATHVSADGFS